MTDWYRLLPRYWHQNAPTCRVWDQILNELLDAFVVDITDSHYADLGGFRVWVANYPYSYGYREGDRVLPKVATRKRLKAAINSRLLSEARAVITKARERSDA